MESAEAIAAALNTGVSEPRATVEEGALIIPPRHLLEVARRLRNDHTWQFDYLSNVTGADYLNEPARLETVYHLYSVALRHGPLVLKVRVPRDDARQPSVTAIWRAAEFQEREAYDLYGIVYEGHPDLRRILMWDGFVGHPMRKDFVHEDQNELEGAEAIEPGAGERS